MQDFDMCHYGEVLTKRDPENQDAKDRFKRLKALQRKIDKELPRSAIPLV
jgi:hypothetical protein